MKIDILQGDSLAVLRTLPSESVHCCVTSPPYWGLRDYGVAGQGGLELTLGDHLAWLVTAFREVRRVLRHDGTLWLNYGDAYASAPNGRSAADTKAAGNDDRTFRDKPISTVGPIIEPRPNDSMRGLNTGSKQTAKNCNVPNGRAVAGGTMKPKDRMLLPARVAIALHDDGWWIRDEIIWHKPNPMPSSVKDRTTPAHEMIYMLTKNPRYYYDVEALKEPLAQTNAQRTTRKYNTKDRYGANNGGNSGLDDLAARMRAGEVTTKNKRSVWTVSPAPFPDAHFATFPPDLIEPCILAGCPWGGTVLDPFGGAGTTGLVARRNGRNSILIELNPEYIGIANRRLFPPSFPWAAP